MDASTGEYGSWNDEDGTIYVWGPAGKRRHRL